MSPVTIVLCALAVILVAWTWSASPSTPVGGYSISAANEIGANFTSPAFR